VPGAATETAGRVPGGPADGLRTALERALTDAPQAARRLRHAGTRVRIEVRDDPRAAVTLALDRERVGVLGSGAEADSTLVLDGGQADAFARGRLPMPRAIVRGEVERSGSVRSFLAVEPILRELLLAQAGDPGSGAGALRAAGRPAADGVRSGAPPEDVLAVQTRGLVKSFGEHRVLDGVDLMVPEGVISVLLGPSGTGKSVMLEHVLGLMRPDAGDVLIRGRAIGDMSRAELLDLRCEIGVMFQDGALFSAMTVYDNVAFPLRQHTSLEEDEIAEVVMGHLAAVGLGNAARRMPNELSGGMRKRAGLARSLALDPGIVLCDEPDSGLDPVRTALLGDLLAEQHARLGGTMVVVTHDVSLAKRLADHISVLWRGRVLEAGMAEEVLASETPFVRQFLTGETDGPLSMDA
jgi:ABC-type transporter Mla maintaining outer membrane lipid asymmetry ATPase subunit MlaF